MAKYRKKYSTGSNLSYNGNPVIDQTTADPYNNQGTPQQLTQASQEQLQQNQMNAGAVGSTNALATSTAATLAGQSGSLGKVGAGMGWLGAATALSGLGKGMIKKDEYGMPANQTGAALNEIMTPDHEQMINDIGNKNWSALAWDSTGMGKFGRMTSQLTGNADKTTGFWGGVNKMLGTPQRPETEDVTTPFVPRVKTMEDTVLQAETGMRQFAMGGELTQYEGYKHEQGGIPLGQTNEVEAGETRGPSNVPDLKDYIYSDKLRVPGKKLTFAKMSKMIESRYSKRANDKLSDEQKERELKSLMSSQENVRTGMMQRAYKKAYGGELTEGFDPSKGNVHNLGPNDKPLTDAQLQALGLTRFTEGSTSAQEGTNGFYKANPYTPSAPGVTSAPQPRIDKRTGLPYVKPTYPTNPASWTGNPMDHPNYNLPTFQNGGRMKCARGGWLNGVWVDDLDQSGPRADGMGGDPNFAADNTNLINATTDLGRSAFTGRNLPMTTETAREAANYRIPGQDAPMEGLPMRSTPSVSTPAADLSETMSPTDMPSSDTPNNTRNFNPSSLYNLGNFMGGAYDIYRGLKGGDPVNYERVKPETVNPELVNYQQSRDMQRRDTKQGFSATQRELRNVNNPAQYLAMMTQLAGSRDKTISDATARSFENEINTNAQIKGRANEFNANSKNQGSQFNASTQRAEQDARQQEKDIASNTLQAGFASFGEALAGTGRDNQARISQEESKKFIGSADFSPIYEKGKVTGYKHKTTGKKYLIG